VNSELKKQLEALLEKHPELAGSKLDFSGKDIAFTPASQTPEAGAANATDSADQSAGLVNIIAGHSPKVEVRKSPVHGYGVFAKDTIEENELIEECRLLKLGYRANYNHDPVLKDYVWAGKNDGEQTKLHGLTQYMSLGFGSLYNHADQPNTTQILNFDTEIMTIKAKQTILKDEEIFISYGKKYFMIRNFWKNINQNKELENFLDKKG
jgi:hypothetical protein